MLLICLFFGLSVLEFKKQERAKEVLQPEEKCTEFRGELGQIQEQMALEGAEMDQSQEDTEEARAEAQKYIYFYNYERIQLKTGVAPLTLRHSA